MGLPSEPVVWAGDPSRSSRSAVRVWCTRTPWLIWRGPQRIRRHDDWWGVPRVAGGGRSICCRPAHRGCGWAHIAVRELATGIMRWLDW